MFPLASSLHTTASGALRNLCWNRLQPINQINQCQCRSPRGGNFGFPLPGLTPPFPSVTTPSPPTRNFLYPIASFRPCCCLQSSCQSKAMIRNFRQTKEVKALRLLVLHPSQIPMIYFPVLLLLLLHITRSSLHRYHGHCSLVITCFVLRGMLSVLDFLHILVFLPSSSSKLSILYSLY